jgi:hypothetical protein
MCLEADLLIGLQFDTDNGSENSLLNGSWQQNPRRYIPDAVTVGNRRCEIPSSSNFQPC